MTNSLMSTYIVKSVKSNLHFRSRLPFKQSAVKSQKFRDLEYHYVKLCIPRKFENWEWKWKMFSKTQFLFHLFYTTLLLIVRQTSFFSKYFFQAKSTTRSLAVNASKRNRFLSGDVELNLGPVLDCKISSVALVCNTTSAFLLNSRLPRHGLRALDVGGGGDCFFKSASHQLYGNPNHHVEVRALAVQYLRNIPGRVIESNLDDSWLRYLSHMSMQGTWADHIVIQAVADSPNLRIHIVESNGNVSDFDPSWIYQYWE